MAMVLKPLPVRVRLTRVLFPVWFLAGLEMLRSAKAPPLLPESALHQPYLRVRAVKPAPALFAAELRLRVLPALVQLVAGSQVPALPAFAATVLVLLAIPCKG